MSSAEEDALFADPGYCEQRSALWHLRRLFLVCASEVAALLGICPYRQSSDVLDQKLQQAGNSTSNVTAAQQNGIDSEDTLIQRFLDSEEAAKLGVVSCSKAGLYISGFLGASPDAILELPDGSKKLLEVKCRATDPGKSLPADVKLQVGTLGGELHVWRWLQHTVVCVHTSIHS